MQSFLFLCWFTFAWTVLSSPIQSTCNASKDIVKALSKHTATQFCSNFLSIPAATSVVAARITTTITAATVTTTVNTVVVTSEISSTLKGLTSTGTTFSGASVGLTTSTTTHSTTLKSPKATTTVTTAARRDIGSDNFHRRAANIPPYLASFRPSDISSACSCLLLPTATLRKISTSTSTVFTTATVSVTKTSTTILSSVKTVTVATSSIKPSTTSSSISTTGTTTSSISTTGTTTITATPTTTTAANTGGVEVFLRIEGPDATIFQGNILAIPQNVTTPSGGAHLCDGTNNGANPRPGGTPTDALATAAAAHGFTFDGTFDAQFDDFFITSIGGSSQTATEFWGVLANYQFTPVGGCQFEVSAGQEILWAFNAFSAVHFLHLVADGGMGPITFPVGSSLAVTVTDGMTGTVVPGATVGGQTTDANGQAVISFPTTGTFTLQATLSGSIRSEIVTIIVDTA